MATLKDITSADWQLSINNAGAVVQDVNDINQCIQTILSTQKGSNPVRPDFGCDLWLYVDQPINTAVPLMVKEIITSIDAYERRIKITNITYDFKGDSNIEFRILWNFLNNNTKESAEVIIDIAPKPELEIPPIVTIPLETPFDFTAEYINEEGVVNWNYTDTTGVSFQVLRGIDGGAFEQVALVATTSYLDTDIDFGKTYAYRVRAIKGSRLSDFSNEDSFETLQPVIVFAAVDDSFIEVVKTGNPALIESESGVTKVYAVDNDPQLITGFNSDEELDPDDNAAISGQLDLSNVLLTGLRNVRSRNQAFDFIPGEWIKNANIDIDITNSIITPVRTTSLIDRIILANGGTTDDDGTDYTGDPGENHANRLLDIGTIELDLGDPENGILYDKIIALETVGWTITTINTLCAKQINFDSGNFSYFATTEVEKTRQLLGLNYISGDPLDVALYETLVDADNGGATGLLASGYINVNNWLLDDNNYNAWIAGTFKAFRMFASDILSVNNVSELLYKSLPTEDRPCGFIEDVKGFVAFAAFSSRDSIQTGYNSNLYLTNSGADQDGDLEIFYDQNQRGQGVFNLDDVLSTDGEIIITNNELVINSAGRAIRKLNINVDRSGNGYNITGRFSVKTNLGSVDRTVFNIVFQKGLSLIHKINVAVRYNESNNMITVQYTDTETGDISILATFSASINQFYTISFSVEEDGESTLYINGVAISTITDMVLVQSKIFAIGIGSGSAGTSSGSQINLTEVLIYDEYLSISQVNSLFNYLNSI